MGQTSNSSARTAAPHTAVAAAQPLCHLQAAGRLSPAHPDCGHLGSGQGTGLFLCLSINRTHTVLTACRDVVCQSGPQGEGKGGRRWRKPLRPAGQHHLLFRVHLHHWPGQERSSRITWFCHLTAQQTPRIPSASVPEQDVDQGRAGVQHGRGQPTGIPTTTMPRHLPGSQLHTRTCNRHTRPWAGLVGGPPRPQRPKVTPPHGTGANHKGF